MEVRFSDAYALREGDIYKTLEVEVRVPLDAAITESDIPIMAGELARDKLKKEAPTLASSDMEIILTNVEIKRRGDNAGMAVYDATAEAYLHATPQKPPTSRRTI
jgi:hypothetical protein